MNTQSREDVVRCARNEYARQWRAKNKDKVRAANQRYWLKVAERTNKEGSENNAKHENH